MRTTLFLLLFEIYANSKAGQLPIILLIIYYLHNLINNVKYYSLF